jgi:polyhydroxybutyrate depolymerase
MTVHCLKLSIFKQIFNMNRRCINIWFLFLVSTAASFAQQTVSGTLAHNGLTREYLLYVPASYVGSEAVPLVLNFHGLGSNAAQQMFYGDFRAIAERENFLIVHPQGTNNPQTEQAFWNVMEGSSDVDDIGFASALIDTLLLEYNINESRIYSTGMSNGGFMSYALACALSDRIAAIASVTGSMTRNQLAQCDPENITPIMEIHGTADLVVPFDGDASFISGIDEVVQFWVDRYLCSEIGSTALDDIDPTDRSTVEQSLFSSCDENASIELIKVFDGGHTWPGAPVNIGVTNHDISASEEIWRFFSQYDLNGSLTSSIDHRLRDVTVFPSPAYETLYVDFGSTKNRIVRVFDLLGHQIFDGKASGQVETIDLSAYETGVYLLSIQEDLELYTLKFLKK